MRTPSAAEYLDDPRFNQIFELPADPARARPIPFKVTYSDYGYRNEAHPEQENVLLFFGSLMSSRFMHVAKDELAKKHKIRIINPDRPGIGGTDQIDVKERMSLWLDLIPALLTRLSIPPGSLACIAAHSGGTVYALDFALHHPAYLHPTRGYLALGGPWILPSHTSSTALALLQRLPAGVVAHTDKLAWLVNNHVAPLLGTSVGISLEVVAKCNPIRRQVGGDGDEEGAAGDEKVRFEDEIQPRIMERVYKEGVKGISGDAVLLLQKVDGAEGWGDWGDYDGYVPRLAEALRATGRRLRVDVFYAEKDMLIGDGGSKGPVWFDRCWNESKGEVIQYQSRTVEGADHDWIWNLRWRAVHEVFEKIGRLGREADGLGVTEGEQGQASG